MKNESLHFYLSFAIIVLGFLTLLTLFIMPQNNGAITAMFVAEKPYCDDNTKLGDCSDLSTGNRCEMTRQGPELVYSEKCYLD